MICPTCKTRTRLLITLYHYLKKYNHIVVGQAPPDKEWYNCCERNILKEEGGLKSRPLLIYFI